MRALDLASALSVGMLFLGGCSTTPIGPKQTLTLRWQRLVNEAGGTCSRCAATGDEVRRAAHFLRRTLRPLNTSVSLIELPMSSAMTAKDTSQSNRIWINDRPLADWLGGTIGMSVCDDGCCGGIGENVECRTLTVDGRTYEAVPAVLIVRAGLLAAEAALAERALPEPCCAAPGG